MNLTLDDAKRFQEAAATVDPDLRVEIIEINGRVLLHYRKTTTDNLVRAYQDLIRIKAEMCAA